MKNSKWMFLLLGVLASGLIAAGCGDDEEASSDAPATEATSEDTGSDTEATTDETSSDDSGSVDSEGVYTACTDAIAGTPAEDAGQTACEQARDAFEQCASSSESVPDDQAEAALKVCQDAADQAIQALTAAQGY